MQKRGRLYCIPVPRSGRLLKETAKIFGQKRKPTTYNYVFIIFRLLPKISGSIYLFRYT